MSRLIIASAAIFEIAPLMDSLSQLGVQSTYISTGIGLTESAIVAGRLRNLVADRHVIFVCTGGIIGDFSKTEIFRGSSVELAPYDARNGDSYLLSQFEPKLYFNSLPINLPQRDICGSLGVSKRLEKSTVAGERLETIELYGVARAWNSVARSFTAIIATTNATGPTAHDEWITNFESASKLTASLLVKELSRLGLCSNRS
jgi:hypothetical protein